MTAANDVRATRPSRSARRRLAVLTAVLVLTACGGGDGGVSSAGDDNNDNSKNEDVSGSAEEPGRGSGGDAWEGDRAILRMINLVGVADGGVDVDVIGPAADFSSDYVYGTVAYGEIAEIEFPEGFDPRIVRSGTDEPVGAGSVTVHGDTEPGRVIVYRDADAGTYGAFEEHRKEGFATVGLVSAIVDPDPNRRYRPSNSEGVCLFSLGTEVPAPMGTPAEGGNTGSILGLGLVGDFAFYVEPGPQTITYADSDEDPSSQGEDCSSFAFDVDIDAEEGKAVFIAFYGDSSDVQATVYREP